MDNKNDKLELMQKTSEIGNNIGIKIADMRKKKGLTQEEFGTFIGVTAQAVSKWEHGGVPDSSLIPIIAEKLGITTDELFGCHTERNIYAYTEEEFLDFVYHYCKNLCFAPDDKKDSMINNDEKYFELLFKTVNVIYKGCLVEEGTSSDTWISKESSKKDTLVLNELISDEGTSFITHNNDFRFLVAVKDTDGLSERLLENDQLCDFFAEFANPNLLRLMIYVQSNGNIGGQYTAEYLSEIMNIPIEETEMLCDKLEKYSFWRRETHIMNNVICTVYTVDRNPYFRPFLMIAYMMVFKSKRIKELIINRAKKML